MPHIKRDQLNFSWFFCGITLHQSRYEQVKIDSFYLHLFMSHHQETFNTWNKIAKIYEDKFMNLDLYNGTYDFFCKKLTERNAKILEVGCGPGNITKYILDQRADFDILGIDIAPNMIQLAMANNPNANFKLMDVRQIHQLKFTYDGIIAGFCIPYLSAEETHQLISSAYNLLHSNGVLYLSFVEGDAMQSGFKSNSQGDQVYFHYHQLAVLKADILKLGFKEPQIFMVDFPRSATEKEVHTIMITEKLGK